MLDTLSVVSQPLLALPYNLNSRIKFTFRKHDTLEAWYPILLRKESDEFWRRMFHASPDLVQFLFSGHLAFRFAFSLSNDEIGARLEHSPHDRNSENFQPLLQSK
jgi:hypothetical protein